MAFRLPASLLLMVGLLAALPASAQEAPLSSADRDAIRSVIEGQEDALKRDDGATAFGFASPMIRDLFGTSDTFMQMVRQGYPMVYRPQSFEFDGVTMKDGRPVQKVRVVGPDGKRHNAYYPMARLPDGTWRIDGCYLEAADENQV
jgi:hypothetical protein